MLIEVVHELIEQQFDEEEGQRVGVHGGRVADVGAGRVGEGPGGGL